MYGPQTFAAQRAYGYSPMVAMGADAPQQTTMDKVKDFLNTENSLIGHGVKNSYILAGGAGIATILYGMSKGWFGRPHRF